MYSLGRWRGMGTLDYYGLLAQANLENCDPRDSACVSNNVAKQAAVEDLWVSKYMVTGAPDDLKLNFTDQTAGQVAEFYNPSNPFSGGNVVDTRNILAVGRGDSTPVVYNPMPNVPPPQSGNHTTAPVQGKTVISSSGPDSSVPGAIANSFQSGGSLLSSIPWWGWLGGVGAAAFALGGKR